MKSRISNQFNRTNVMACVLGAMLLWADASFAQNVKTDSIDQAVCPTANCPAPPRAPVLARQWLHGVTAKGESQPEWLSTLGLLVKTGNPDGQKVGQYIGVLQQKGAGTAWALNTDSVRNAVPGGSNSFGGFEGSGRPDTPGNIGVRNGTIGYELDFTNWDAMSGPGVGAFTVGQYVHAQGSFRSLAALYFDAHMADDQKAWHTGILFNGNQLFSDHSIFDGSNSHNSLSISGHHKTGINTTQANNDIISLSMSVGQKACFAQFGWCMSSNGAGLSVSNSRGDQVFEIDEAGNLTITGSIKSRDGQFVKK